MNIKKSYLFFEITLVLLLFSTSLNLLAISDDCASHGGVDCNYGPDHDGSIVCKDGYKNSQINFKDADACWQFNQNAQELDCSLPKPVGCTKEIDYIRKKSLLMRTSELSISEITNHLLVCEEQIENYKHLIDNFKNCLINKEKQYTNSPDYSLYTYTLNHLHNFCHQNYGYESSYNEKLQECECGDGYWLDPDENICKVNILMCQKYFGEYATANENNCVCRQGYIFEWDKAECIKEIKSPNQTYLEEIFKELYQRPSFKNTLEQIIENLPFRKNKNSLKIYTNIPEKNMVGYMVKAHSDPKTYLVTSDNTLRWVTSENVAKRLYGYNWNKYIIWLDESLIYTFNFSKPILD